MFTFFKNILIIKIIVVIDINDVLNFLDNVNVVNLFHGYTFTNFGTIFSDLNFDLNYSETVVFLIFYFFVNKIVILLQVFLTLGDLIFVFYLNVLDFLIIFVDSDFFIFINLTYIHHFVLLHLIDYSSNFNDEV